mmetsp:Transcript_11391/g.28749  ORF Transcript_11391/g.28749 Transcript_11391/m.28749 type:complete len:280 (+) Transcript_11391:104-943(+)
MQAPPPSDNVFVGDLPESMTAEECEAVFQAYGSVVSCRMLPPKGHFTKPSALVRFGSVEEAQWVVESLNGNLAEGLEEPVVVRFANAPGTGGKGPSSGFSQQGPYGKGSQGKGFAGALATANGGKGGAGGYGKANGKSAGGKVGPRPQSVFTLYGAIKKAGLLGPHTVPKECTVYVKNLPLDASDIDLYKLFAPFGAIAPTGVKAMMDPDGTCQGIGFVDYIDPNCAQTAITTLNGFALPDGSCLHVSGKLPSKKGQGKGGHTISPAAIDDMSTEDLGS